MSRAARVTSLDAVRQFREALSDFNKDARDHLAAADATLRRTTDWLSDRLKLWQRELRVRQDEMNRARNELYRREQMKKQGTAPGTADQEKAFRVAQARVKEAEDKIKHCRRWQPLWQHALNEYQGSIRALQNALNLNLVHALHLLDQKLEALEAYLAIAPPGRSGLSAPIEAATESQTTTVGRDPVADSGDPHEPGHQPTGTDDRPEESTPALE